MTPKLVLVTPAGREHYLELLKHYVLADPLVSEWHLWDNCRKADDRIYINALARQHPKIKVIRMENSDGTNKSINRFYRHCSDAETFYVKLDDDIVFIEENTFEKLYQAAVAGRESYLWWSPLVINNAICSWLLKYYSKLEINDELSCQAADVIGWKSAEFALRLHEAFLSAAQSDSVDQFRTPDFSPVLSRFSINCIGFFGSDVAALGQGFCPENVDDEEWLSACLPLMEGRPGRIVGSALVVHFAFYPQEQELLRSRVLDRYYALVNKAPPPYWFRKLKWHQRIRRKIVQRLVT